jgi:hypothetical protein
MKNNILIFGALMFMTSCGLLFTTSEPKEVSTLALSGGGYLSTDNHNEISPFLFRASSGTNYLFFSSDRAGSYDIYYAIMDKNGNFSAPVKLNSPINTADDEIYPVFAYTSMGTRLAFLRVSSTNTNLSVYNIDLPDLTNIFASGGIKLNATGLGYIKRSFTSILLILLGNNSILELNFDNSMIENPYTNTNNLTGNIYALANTKYIIQTNGSAEIFIKDTLVKNKHQLLLEGTLKIDYGTFALISNIAINDTIYSSGFNDISPFVDFAGGGKIYFASDRFGKGNYDLYRYNVFTLNALPDVKALTAWDMTPPSISNIYPANGQMVSTGPDSLLLDVTDNAGGSGVFGVYYSLNNSIFIEIPYSNGYNTLVYVQFGNNDIKAYAVDKAGNFSKTNSITVIGK